MTDENESSEPQAGTASSHPGRVEDIENRGSVGGANSGVGDVTGDDTFGSKQGAGAAQGDPKTPMKPDASGAGSGMSSHEQSIAADPSHHEGIGKGEQMATQEEAGRFDSGTTGAGRPAGGSTARDSTGINPDNEEPIDPDSPSTPANQ